MTGITFIVPGKPVGKGRPRISSIGGHPRMFTPPKTASYEALVRLFAAQAMEGSQMLLQACSASISAIYEVPASWSQKKQRAALAGDLFPTGKPDMDNIVKAICDGMNGIVWKDDAQAVSVSATKTYGPQPCVIVSVRPIGGAR